MGRRCTGRAQLTVNQPDIPVAVQLRPSPPTLKNYTMIKVASGCYFEPEEDEPIDPIVGKKTSMDIPNPIYYRKSELDDVPDDYATRIMKMRRSEKVIPEREVKTPDGFTITIAYNKSGYQVIPKEDLKNFK